MNKREPDYLTESYIIRRTDPRWQELDHMAWLAKNVFNCTNYVIRQAFFADRNRGIAHDKKHRNWTKLLGFTRLKEIIRKTYPDDYSALPKRVTETIIMSVISMWRSYDAMYHDWQYHPHKYLGKPNLPHYKASNESGRAECLWNQEAIHKRPYAKQGVISLSGCQVMVEPGDHIREQICRLEGLDKDTQINLHKRIAVVKCQPRADHYQITITYAVYPKLLELDASLVAGIDLGVNNLMAITSNKAGFQPILVNGRPLKSLNQYFNKKRAQLQQQLPQGQYSSKQLVRLHRYRARQMKNILHTLSKQLIEVLVREKIGVLVIGKNEGWKQKVKLGKTNNQNFLSIPHSQFIEMLIYKAKLVGIQVIITEESYTSKCSFLDDEPLHHHECYAGKRIMRGLFRAQDGRLINADVNASYNIIRKALPNAFADGIEDVAVHPLLGFPA